MIKQYCDRCSKEIVDKNPGWFRVQVNYAVGVLRDPIRPDEDRKWTLCPDCLKLFKNWLED